MEKGCVSGRVLQTGGKTLVRKPGQGERAHGQVTETLGWSTKRGFYGDEEYDEDVERERLKRIRGSPRRMRHLRDVQNTRKRRTSGS